MTLHDPTYREKNAMRRTTTIAALLFAGALTVSACGAQATQDRAGGAGRNPDAFEDAWNVKVFPNADSVPNTVLFCINRSNPIAILSTLSGGDAGKDKAAQIVPMPGLDVSYCGGRPK